MLGFIKKYFFTRIVFLLVLTGVNSLSCISMNNQECKVRPQIVNVNEMILCLSLLALKQVNTVVIATIQITLYAKLCVPDVVKNLNVKVFNLMSRTNETRHVEWNETCKCKCRLDGSVCNNKQRWNEDKCRCECKEIIDKGVYDKVFIWNPSNCECEYYKSCDFSEYLDYKNCKCEKRLVDKIVEECTDNAEETTQQTFVLMKTS